MDSDLKKECENIWGELTTKPPYSENYPFKSSIEHSLHGKHKKIIERYLLFFTQNTIGLKKIIKPVGNRLATYLRLGKVSIRGLNQVMSH